MRPFEEWMNQMNISKTAAMYIVEKDKENGITTWMYIPEEKKEIKMSETNLQHYKEELKKIYNKHYEEPKEIIKGIKAYIGETITYDYQSCTDAILNWMAQPYKKPILDNVEREYLSAVIKPFRGKVSYISKHGNSELMEFIYIKLSDGDAADFPNFEANTMYRGMELDKNYTPEELGL